MTRRKYQSNHSWRFVYQNTRWKCIRKTANALCTK